jgi:two-component system, NarL family, captular synthesis response regulator RcsB
MTVSESPAASPGRVRVIVADDHPIVRVAVIEAFAALSGYAVAASANSGLDLLNTLHKVPCDLIVTDLAMCWEEPATDGMSLVRWLRLKYPCTPIVVFTMTTSSRLFQELIQAGVAGIVTKNDSLRELMKVCQYARSGTQTAVSDTVARQLSTADTPRAFKPRLSLTWKEREIVQLVARGMSLTEIARRSGRTVSTVGTQKMVAMRKLDVTSDLELVQYAMLHGLVS